MTVDPAGQPGLTFNERVPQYTSSVQNEKTRTFADHAGASYTETYHDNKFMNSWVCATAVVYVDSVLTVHVRCAGADVRGS